MTTTDTSTTATAENPSRFDEERIVGRVVEESAETGTVMRPDTFRRYAGGAGFSGVEELAIEHDMFRFYRPLR